VLLLRFVVSTFLLLPCLSAAESPEFSARQFALEHRLMAPCCYNGLVAAHQSGAASELRLQIASLLRQGKTDREILDAVVDRYGKRILAEPEGRMGSLLQVIPPVALLLGLCGVIVAIQRLRVTASQPAGNAMADIDIPED